MPTLICADGFDHYSTTANMQQKWTTTNIATFPTGRPSVIFTGKAINTTFVPNNCTKTFDGGSTYSTICVGFAINFALLAGSIFKVTNTLTGLTVTVSILANGMLQIASSNTVTIPAFVANLSTWYHFAFVLSISGSVLTYTFYVNGNGSPAATGTVTSNVTSGQFLEINLGGGISGGNNTIDDFYLTDGEYLGDITIISLYPNAAGDFTTWTATPGPNNYAMVNEHNPDGNSTIVSVDATGIGNKDAYNLDDLPTTNLNIVGAQLVISNEKTDAGSATIQGFLRSGSSEDHTADFNPSAASYSMLVKRYRKSPFTSVDFTPSEINSMQIGIQRTS